MTLTAKDKYLLELFKTTYEIEMRETQKWITDGQVLNMTEYPMYIDLSQDVLDEFFKEETSRGGIVSEEMLIYEIGKETNAIYNDSEDDSYENRCNYACTLFELYKVRIVKERF
jgi:hypothetical protein